MGEVHSEKRRAHSHSALWYTVEFFFQFFYIV
jgi:hypothetical protein